MTGFNPLHIITRITNSVVSSVAIQNSTAQSAGQNQGLNSNFNNLAQNLQSTSQNNAPMFFKSAPLTLSLVSEQKLTTMEINEKANYAKDLLNLPKDFSELINQITSGAQNPSSANILNQQMAQELQKLLQNGKIDLTALSNLLNDNSKAAMQKLMMTIANVAKYGANDVSTLKELMNLFATSSAIASESQALKTLMLLYLPWLPLSDRADNNLDFTIDIFDKIDGPDPDNEETEETVRILIQTNNFSNVTVLLTMNALNQVDVDISAPENFPHKKVIEHIKEEAMQNNIKSNVSSGASKNLSEVKMKGETEIQHSSNVKISAAGSISPKLMLMAQALIKIIIQVDYEKTIIKNTSDGEENDSEESTV